MIRSLCWRLDAERPAYTECKLDSRESLDRKASGPARRSNAKRAANPKAAHRASPAMPPRAGTDCAAGDTKGPSIS